MRTLLIRYLLYSTTAAHQLSGWAHLSHALCCWCCR